MESGCEGKNLVQADFSQGTKVIEYQPADLKIGGVESAWKRIASVIDPGELDSMTLQPQVATFDGRSVSAYRGVRQGMAWQGVTYHGWRQQLRSNSGPVRPASGATEEAR